MLEEIVRNQHFKQMLETFEPRCFLLCNYKNTHTFGFLKTCTSSHFLLQLEMYIHIRVCVCMHVHAHVWLYVCVCVCVWLLLKSNPAI